MITILIIILIVSLILALRSMKDFEIPDQIKHMLLSNRIKGTIVFFKDKITHYH